jgi:hypothetical protein
MQRILGGLVAARLPLEPTATIVLPAHFKAAKRTTNRPPKLAVTDFRFVPVETTTRSLGLKPRPLTSSGYMLVIVRFARTGDVVDATSSLCAAPPSPSAISASNRPISNTTLEV